MICRAEYICLRALYLLRERIELDEFIEPLSLHGRAHFELVVHGLDDFLWDDSFALSVIFFTNMTWRCEPYANNLIGFLTTMIDEP